MKYTIGIDFGTLSARAALLCLDSGKIVSSYTANYPHGVMDNSLPCGTPLPPDFALQHPDDYLFALKESILGALKAANVVNTDVLAVGIDFTSCTILPHLNDGTPLCNLDAFKSDPHAYVKLWKHHGAKKEAEDLERVARERGESWLKFYNNTVSSENYFSKVLETFRNSPSAYNTADRFTEAGDWLSFMLTGVYTHSISFSGFKAFWSKDAGFPSEEYFEAVDPSFKDVVKTKLVPNVVGACECVGTVCESGAVISGLAVGTKVVTPLIDAHVPLISLGITKPQTLMMVLGTSGCYIVNDTDRKELSGICGSSVNSVIPNLCTYEAALACFGDQLDWYIKTILKDNYESSAIAHSTLTEKASQLKIGESGLVALNWFNGNRCPLSNFNLSGAIFGLTLTTRPQEIYRALLEGACFATAIIIKNYKNSGIQINDIVATGGISQKNPFFVGMLADILDIPITVTSSTEAAAHGCAIMASVVAGKYSTLDDACKNLSAPSQKQYLPNFDNHKQYQKLFDLYKNLHNLLGVQQPEIMSSLKEIRQSATKMDME